MKKKMIKDLIVWRILLVAAVILFVPFAAISVWNESELRREIGQMIITGFRGTEAGDDSAVSRMIREVQAGGVILFDVDMPSGRAFPRNITGPAQTKKLIADIKKYSKTPLFVAVDAEGGKVNRLKPEYGFADIPSARDVGERNDDVYTRAVAEKLAGELAELGFNMDFAPSVDVDINSANPIIGGLGRSFSKDPEIVAKDAAIYIESARKRNIVSVLKHFPGHGSSAEDSHLGLVDVTATYKEEELIPYEILIRRGEADCIMTAHIMDRRIDKDRPATLSSFFIKGILREKLRFEGVVISDDIQMGAIVSRYTLADAVASAVNAGCDIILAANNGKEYDEMLPYKVRDAVLQGVRNGTIPRERIKEASGRIDVLKKKVIKTQ